MGADFLSAEEGEKLRAKAKEMYGSIPKLARVVGMTSGDLYCVINGTKPLFPRWKSALNDALDQKIEVCPCCGRPYEKKER